MAYGNTLPKDDYSYRALPVGVGALTVRKKEEFALMRSKHLETLREMAKVAFVEEPLLRPFVKADVEKRLLAFQKEMEGYNKAYAEKARLTVTEAVGAQCIRYFNKLVGRLAHCAEKVPDNEKEAELAEGVATTSRVYWQVPLSLQDVILPTELAELESLAKKGHAHALEVFRKVVLQGVPGELTPGQVAVLTEIHTNVRRQYKPIPFADAETTVQIHLDYRVVGGKTGLPDVLSRLDEGMANVLRTGENKKYKTFVAVSNAVPRQPGIRVPLILAPAVYQRLFVKTDTNYVKEFSANSLALELGPSGKVGMRLIVVQRVKTLRPVEEHRTLVARDFGYKNTITLSVLRLEEPLAAKRIEEIQAFTKIQAERYLTTHQDGGAAVVVERLRLSGKNFLDKVQKHCVSISRLQTKIAKAFLVLDDIKQKLCSKIRKTVAEVVVRKEDFPQGHPAHAEMRGFFKQLTHLQDLQKARKSKFKAIQGLKKSWLGFVSNVELQMVQKHDALLVREDLTIVPIEKEGGRYRGRIFNKMLTNGACGRYQKMATAKYVWNGVSEVKLPAYFTSTTCTQHARVDPKSRKGDWYACPLCLADGKAAEHADEHAADTLGKYLLLHPVKSLPVTNTIGA